MANKYVMAVVVAYLSVGLLISGLAHIENLTWHPSRQRRWWDHLFFIAAWPFVVLLWIITLIIGRPSNKNDAGHP